MTPNDREHATDGGGTAESPFNIDSDIQHTRLQRYQNMLDLWVFTPFRIIWQDLRARIGISIIIFYILMATVGVAVLDPPGMNEGPQTLSPFVSWEFPLGTTGYGQDLLAQTVYATPPMLKMILSGAVFATFMATFIGLLTGFHPGRAIDKVLTLFTDVMLTVPGLVLVMVIAIIFQPRNPFVIGLILSINGWAGLARSIRSEVLKLRSESYVEASRVIGVPLPRILTEDILPNLMSYITIHFVYQARNVIFSSVALYFLGILPFSNQNWGVMMNIAYKAAGALYTWDSAHWLLVPMMAIVILVFGLTMFAQGADRIFNPRIRARHAKVVASEPADEEEAEEGGETIARI
jgi:peptide/nickel transport system permease protein